MQPFRDASGHDLVRVHTDPLRWEHELRSGPDTFARLCYAAAFGTRASGATTAETWTFDRAGVLHPQVTASVTGSGSVAGTVELGLLGRGGRGKVRLSDGHTFEFAPTDVAGLGYAMTNGDGGVIYRCKRPVIQHTWTREGKVEAQLEVAPTAWSTPALPLLVLLGRYLIVP
jgi:hypothetical protein